MEKPKSLDQIWCEGDLCGRLGLSTGKNGRSRQLSAWIKDGLRHVEKSNLRFFFENDVIDFLFLKYQNKYGQ